MSDHDKRIKEVESMAEQHGLVDTVFMTLIKRLTRALKAEFKEFDSGIGIGYADYQIKYGGVEYTIKIEPTRTLDQKAPS